VSQVGTKGHKAEKGMVPAMTEKRGRIGERWRQLADWILDPSVPSIITEDGSQHGRRMAGGRTEEPNELVLELLRFRFHIITLQTGRRVH
jgi:hypothetical protein